jgi:hypothetical protein
MKRVAVVSLLLFISCGTLQKNALKINPGDGKEQVIAVLGQPQDRQFQGETEVWQFCQTGAGFGYHDYRVVWFYRGKVTGITSYKDHTPASGCAGHFRPVQWEEAPKHE